MSSTIRELILPSTVIVVLLAFPSLSLGQACTTGDVVSGNPAVQVCSGYSPPEPAPTSRGFNMNGALYCSQYGYYGTTFQNSASVSAHGECGNATPNTEPQCAGIVGGAGFKNWTGSGFTWSVESAPAYWFSTGCQYPDPSYPLVSLPTEDCCGPTCSSYGAEQACIHAGGLLSGCVCGFSPIVISLDGVVPALTDARRGVLFDMLPDGTPEQTAWTRADRNDAFLALDRNRNGQIDSSKELFGSTTDQPPAAVRNGFNALSAFDSNKDNRIDRRDPVYYHLRLWVDSNHNGRSEMQELQSLESAGVLSLGLVYREISQRDAYGNLFKYVAPITFRIGDHDVHRMAYDVFFFAR